MPMGSREVRFKIQPWFRDHCFEGRPVLPAVESLLLLADQARSRYPLLEIQTMHEACFARFLELPEKAEHIVVFIELDELENSSIRAGLYSRRKTGKFSRLVEHASVVFDPQRRDTQGGRPLDFSAEKSSLQVSGKQLYAELVPFGPAYQNLSKLVLYRTGAAAELRTPNYSLQPGQKDLGSPFLLDSALHAACVWGQRFVGFVPFPVGFNSRRVISPSQPDRDYRAELVVIVGQGSELEFDMDLINGAGDLVEQVRGVRMRDVSGGRIMVPDWVKQ